MLITYGPVSLNLISVNEFNRQAVYFGPNYCYTKFRLGIRAWFNPNTQKDAYRGATTISGPGSVRMIPPPIPANRADPIGPPLLTPSSGPVVGPPFVSSVPPLESDKALRHLLLQPRLPLQFSFLGGVSVQSPLPGFPCDVKGGPTPIECKVSEISPRTWVVDWTVETAINETYFYNGKGYLPLVLAQMWQMRHALDQDFFTTRIIEGQTLFRLDALASVALTPDDFRQQLFVPPPVGFKRDKVEVWNDPDNPGLIQFRVVDRQVPFGWSGAHITRLNAHHRIRTTKDTLGHVIGNHWKDLKESGWELTKSAALAAADITGTVIPNPLEPLFAVGSLPIGWMLVRDALRASEAAVSTVWDALPVSYHTVEVEAWGDPLSQRDAMEAFARQIVSARLSSFFVFALPAILVGQAANNATNSIQAPDLPGGVDLLVPGGGILRAAYNASKATLNNAAKMVSNIVSPALNVASGALTAIVPYGVDTTIDHDINGKYIHLSHTCISGPVGTVFNGAQAVINNTPMPLMEETFLNGTPLISAQVQPPQPPFSNGTRGTFLEDMVGTALQLPNSLPLDMPAGKSAITKGIGFNPILNLNFPPLPLVI